MRGLPVPARPASELFLLMLAVDAGVVLLHFFNELLGFNAQIFDLDSEQNLPTWLESSQFAAVAVCSALAGRAATGRDRLAWWTLAAVFLFFSADETATVHEKLAKHVDFPVSPLPLIYSPIFLASALALVAIIPQVRRALGAELWLLAGFALLGIALFLDVADLQALDVASPRIRPLILLEEASEMLGTTSLATIALATFLVRLSDRSRSPSP